VENLELGTLVALVAGCQKASIVIFLDFQSSGWGWGGGRAKRVAVPIDLLKSINLCIIIVIGLVQD
jgi:hypothetical protein